MFKTNTPSARKIASFALIAGLAASAAALALPVARDGESYTFSYYSDAARTDKVGERMYGYCGEPYRWGRVTAYSSYYKTTCHTDP
ncbi:hypothetical protein [Pseudomonas sp. CGJS7]|uniref:hypothetical protein n=1 Tax=Pseudomonas sp. CGJS7 TaxID=3109348 RepID=UPI003009D54E